MNAPAQPTHPRQHALEALTLMGIFSMVALYCSRTIWDIDIFWHIAAGRAFWTSKGIPDTDIFSAIDPERTWVTFQWGYEMLVFALDSLGGLELVRRIHAVVMLLAFFLFWLGCRKRLQIGPWMSILLTALMVVLFEDRIRVRPHIFNLLAWSILFPWLVRGPEALNRRALWGTGVVVALWANIHAGGAFLFLLAAITLPVGACLAHVAGQDNARLRPTVFWYCAALLAALLAPHFIRGNIQALTMLEASESAIGEWLPAWHFIDYALSSADTHCGNPGQGFYPVCLLRSPSATAHLICGTFPTFLAAVWLLTILQKLRENGWSLPAFFRVAPYWRHGLILALLILSHRSVRFVYIAMFVWLCLRPMCMSYVSWKPQRDIRRLLYAFAIAGLLLVSYRFNVSAQHPDLSTCIERAVGAEPLDRRRFPIAQAEFLRRTGFKGGIFCQGNWGGYLLWKLWPNGRVTADGRGNYAITVTEDLATIYDRSNFRTADAGERIRRIYERYPVDAVVHQHPIWPSGYRPDPNAWVPVQQDAKGGIWIRRTPNGEAYLERLRAMVKGP